MTHRELAQWALTTFRLRRPPPRTTLYRVLKVGPADQVRSPSRKTVRSVTCPALDEALVEWVGKCERWKLPIVTGGIIREKAAKIRDDLIATASPVAVGAMKTMAFSNGWLGKFMNRHHLTSRRVQGEAASVDLSAVEKGRAALQQITQAYARRDMFNMDETAYFYCMPPSRAISSHQVSGRKNPKKRLTVAVACNADGSTKLPLLFIGSSRQPRCFYGKSCMELGVDYASAAKAWMNTQLFNCWAARFNDAMRAEGRHVLLLLDNASLHRVDEPLSNVSVQMLPPNTTYVCRATTRIRRGLLHQQGPHKDSIP